MNKQDKSLHGFNYLMPDLDKDDFREIVKDYKDNTYDIFDDYLIPERKFDYITFSILEFFRQFMGEHEYRTFDRKWMMDQLIEISSYFQTNTNK